MTKIFNNTSSKLKRRMLRKLSPQPEVILWTKLRGKQLTNLKFRRQYSIDNFIVDFYCPKLKFAIEIDGNSHFRSKMKEKDVWRQSLIEQYGIRFLRFNNKEIMENIDGVLETILKNLNLL